MWRSGKVEKLKCKSVYMQKFRNGGEKSKSRKVEK